MAGNVWFLEDRGWKGVIYRVYFIIFGWEGIMMGSEGSFFFILLVRFDLY